jgi:hypothetical protein
MCPPRDARFGIFLPVRSHAPAAKPGPRRAMPFLGVLARFTTSGAPELGAPPRGHEAGTGRAPATSKHHLTGMPRGFVDLRAG